MRGCRETTGHIERVINRLRPFVRDLANLAGQAQFVVHDDSDSDDSDDSDADGPDPFLLSRQVTELEDAIERAIRSAVEDFR